MKTLGERLVYLRESCGRSARELGELVGLAAETHWSAIETGRRKEPRHSTMRLIADTFGVTVGWLFDGEGERPGAAEIHARIEQLCASRTIPTPPEAA